MLTHMDVRRGYRWERQRFYDAESGETSYRWPDDIIPWVVLWQWRRQAPWIAFTLYWTPLAAQISWKRLPTFV